MKFLRRNALKFVAIALFSLFALLMLWRNEEEPKEEGLRYSLGDLHANRSFDASLLATLAAYRLTDAQIAAAPSPSSFVKGGVLKFVLASDARFYPSLRATIASIQRHFPNRHKVVLYDLGGLSTNATLANELKGVCNLTMKVFDFGVLPEDVRGLQNFSWKVAIIAKELMKPEERFIYADTSVLLQSPVCEDLFAMMSAGKMASIRLPSSTIHTIKFATHSNMYNYLPSRAAKSDSSIMVEAGLFFVERSKFALRVMKWAVLCAYTRDCIDPIGAKIQCPLNRMWETALCHRQDQSMFNLLMYNEEERMMWSRYTDRSFYGHWTHKRVERNCFSILHFHKTNRTIAACHATLPKH